MDNLTVNKSQAVSFNSIKVQKGLYNNPKRKAIAEYISKKLNEVDSTNNRSQVQNVERYGYDVFLSRAKNKDSVRVDIVDRLSHKKPLKPGESIIDKDSLVGTYNSPEQFQTKDFSNKFYPYEKSLKQMGYTLYGFAGAILAGIIALTVSLNKSGTHINNTQPETTIAKDSLKAKHFEPIMEDAFKVKRVLRK